MRSRSGSKRTSSAVVVAVMLGGLTAFAQNQRPVPTESPDVIVGRSVRVHVIASEDLEPDVLRALARPLPEGTRVVVDGAFHLNNVRVQQGLGAK